MTLAGFFCAFLFLPVWARRKMGAGDVKAIAILGLLLGFAPLLVTLVGRACWRACTRWPIC